MAVVPLDSHHFLWFLSFFHYLPLFVPFQVIGLGPSVLVHTAVISVVWGIQNADDPLPHMPNRHLIDFLLWCSNHKLVVLAVYHC